VRGGQPGAFRDSIIPGRMLDNVDGTVTDKETGLMWQQGETGAMTWKAALSYCENLQLADYDDWRLPSRNELQSIVDYQAVPAINKEAFPGAISGEYWSSTLYIAHGAAHGSSPIYMDFYYPHVGCWGLLSNLNVRAVRGGQ
jgi:hypothetical protein